MSPFPPLDPIRASARAYAQQLRQDLRHFIGDEVVADQLLPADPSWEDIFAAETELLWRMPDKHLQRRAWIVYGRFADVAGSERAARWAASKAPDPNGNDLEALRADLLQLQSEMARQHALSTRVEEERAGISRLIVNIATVALIVLGGFIAAPFLRGSLAYYGAVTFALVAAFVIAVVLYVRERGFHRARSEEITTRTPLAGAGMILSVMLLCAAPVEVAAQETATATTGTASATATTTTTSTGTAATDTVATDTVSKPGSTGKAGATAGKPEKTPPDTGGRCDPPPVPAGMTLMLVAIAGVLGATFSVLQRIQRPSGGADPLRVMFNLRAARAQVGLSLVSGAIAALVLYAILTGKMLDGALFPQIVNGCLESEGVAMWLADFFKYTGPETHVDHGKLLAWAFVAGFAERFVPDILDRFTSGEKA